jgi:hypothetical protein
MIAEKDLAMGQFETIAEQKAVIDQAQVPLLKELNDVKKQIDAFDDRRQEAMVGVYSLSLFYHVIYCSFSDPSCTSR